MSIRAAREEENQGITIIPEDGLTPARMARLAINTYADFGGSEALKYVVDYCRETNYEEV